jgi:hypothetical protein
MSRAPSTLQGLAAGPNWACALLDDATVRCWGRTWWTPGGNEPELVGDEPGEMGDALRPVPL